MADLAGRLGTGYAYRATRSHGRALAPRKGTQAGLTHQDDFQAVFLVTRMAWTYVPPQPPSIARNPVLGLTGGTGATIMSGQALPVRVALLGDGQGFVLTPLDPFNVSPVDDVRRYTVISFDVLAGSLSALLVTFSQGPATEMAFKAGTWLEPYKQSIAVPVSGGFRFQVRRSDGWRQPPGLSVYRFQGPTAPDLSSDGPALGGGGL